MNSISKKMEIPRSTTYTLTKLYVSILMKHSPRNVAQSVGAVEYTNCNSAEG